MPTASTNSVQSHRRPSLQESRDSDGGLGSKLLSFLERHVVRADQLIAACLPRHRALAPRLQDCDNGIAVFTIEHGRIDELRSLLENRG